jgi:hypothetical protein
MLGHVSLRTTFKELLLRLLIPKDEQTFCHNGLLVQKARRQQASTMKSATYAAIFAYLQLLRARMQLVE